MGTLADLKRKLSIGQGLKLVDYKDRLEGNNSKLNIVRYVVKTQGNGVYLNPDKEAKSGSFLEFPKASSVEFIDNGFNICFSGYRDLTEEEKNIIANEPKDEEQSRIDIMTDGSQMFWRCKRYYKEQNAEYLSFGNSKPIRGLYRTTDKENKDVIRDDSIKGEMSLSYEFVD